jgi:arginine repressor
LALALDGAGHADLLGTLAGDDTILLIAADGPGATGLLAWLEGLE